MSDNKKQVVVLGAGVVGLTTAVKIQEYGGYDVTIVSEVIPSDPKTIRYTSPWAGAHHVLNWTEDDRQQQMDIDTFKIMWEMSKPGSETEHLFLRLDQTEYFKAKEFVPPLECMPDFKIIEPDQLPPGVVYGLNFKTVTIDTPVYLQYLADRFTKSGGKIVKAAVHHILQIVEGGANIFSSKDGAAAPPDAVVVCTGLGTRFLGGVEDKTMFPIRGQTVIIRAPWVRFGRTLGEPDGTWTYVIPRRSGDVILGGSKGVNDWFPRPRPETRQDILERNLAMCPELAPPEIREKRTPTVDDLIPLIVEEGCGLRPARKDGIRLEVEWLQAGKSDKKVAIVHNYGHGGYGYQSSWGSAEIALTLLRHAVKPA